MLGKFFDEIDFLEVEKLDFEKVEKYASDESSLILFDRDKNQSHDKYAKSVLKSSNKGLEPIYEDAFEYIEYKEIEAPPKAMNHTVLDLVIDSERVKENFTQL